MVIAQSARFKSLFIKYKINEINSNAMYIYCKQHDYKIFFSHLQIYTNN